MKRETENPLSVVFSFFFFSKVNSYPLFYNHKSLVNVTKNILGKMKDNIDAAKQILV